MLWNPFAFTVHGDAVPPAAPPALRVLGGQQATAQQLSFAQQAFYQFCSRARLSLVANPMEQGRLQDGTPYRIVVIGPQTFMEIWPAETGQGDGRGIGTSFTDRDGVVRMLILTFLRDRWRLRLVDSFYGGSGLWVASKGAAYFTDDSLTQVPGATFTQRWFHASVAGGFAQARATSVVQGLAYDNGNDGVGLITNGKYVQVKQDALGALIAEAPGASAAQFAQTPNVFFDTPHPAATVTAPEIPGVPLAAPLNTSGHLRHSRMRDGSAVRFPLVDLDQPALMGADGGGWITQQALTHELVVGLGADGYRADVVLNAEVEIVERVPDMNPAGASLPWRITQFEWQHGYDVLPTVISASGERYWPGTGWAASAPIMMKGAETSGTRDTVLERSDSRRSPVFVARAWDGGKVGMTVLTELSQKITSHTSTRNVEDTGMVSTVVIDEVEHFATGASETLGFELQSVSPTMPQPIWIYSTALYLDSAPSDPNAYWGVHPIRSEAFTETTGRSVSKVSLETPWGDLVLLDNDTTNTERFTYITGDWSANAPLPETRREFVSIVGATRLRTIRFIDPILGIIGYVEFFTNEFTVALASGGAFTVATRNSTASFVLWHRGSKILEFGLPPPKEGSALKDGLELSAGRTVSALDVNIDPQDTRIPVTFPSVWSEDTDPEFTMATSFYMFDRKFGHGVADHPENRLLGETITDMGRPRVSDPEGGYGLSITSAIDPNSGGGAVMVRQGGALKGAWAIAPNGARTPLQSLIAASYGPPQILHDLLVSV